MDARSCSFEWTRSVPVLTPASPCICDNPGKCPCCLTLVISKSSLVGHIDSVSSLYISLSSSGPLLVSGSFDGTAKIWSMKDYKCIYTCRPCDVNKLNDSDTSNTLGDSDVIDDMTSDDHSNNSVGCVTLVESSLGHPLFLLVGCSQYIWSYPLSQLSECNNSIHQDGVLLRTHSDDVSAISVVPSLSGNDSLASDAKGWVISCDDEGDVLISSVPVKFDEMSNHPCRMLCHKDSHSNLCSSVRGLTPTSSTSSDLIVISSGLDCRVLKWITPISIHPGLTTCTINDSWKTLKNNNMKDRVDVFNLSKLKESMSATCDTTHPLMLNPPMAHSLSITSDQQVMGIGSGDSTITVVHIPSMRPFTVLTDGHLAAVTAVDFISFPIKSSVTTNSTDLRWLISGGNDGVLCIWTISTLHPPPRLLTPSKLQQKHKKSRNKEKNNPSNCKEFSNGRLVLKIDHGFKINAVVTWSDLSMFYIAVGDITNSISIYHCQLKDFIY